MKQILSLTCACALTLALTACTGGAPSDSSGSSLESGNISSSAVGSFSGIKDTSSSAGDISSDGGDISSNMEDNSSISGSVSLPQPGDLQATALYIGMDGQFQEYLVAVEEDITPQLLVEEIAKLTGWNLDLADEITSGKGGMTVTFAETCALFVGPPDPQKDEFHVFDAAQLDQTILDSVKKTLQNWAVVPGLGNPDAVDIYFCGPDGSDLVLTDLGVTIPSIEPYQAFPDLP